MGEALPKDAFLACQLVQTSSKLCAFNVRFITSHLRDTLT